MSKETIGKWISAAVVIAAIAGCLLMQSQSGWAADYRAQRASDGKVISLSEEELEQVTKGIIYFGKSDCPTCKDFAPLVKEVAAEEGLTIYSVDTNQIRDNTKLSKDELDKFFQKYVVYVLPTVVTLEKDDISNQMYEDASFDTSEAGLQVVKERLRSFLLGPERKSTAAFISENLPQYRAIMIMFLIAVFLFVLSVIYAATGVSCYWRLPLLTANMGAIAVTAAAVLSAHIAMEPGSIFQSPQHLLLAAAAGVLGVVSILTLILFRKRKQAPGGLPFN